jgi:hypothetical protein
MNYKKQDFAGCQFNPLVDGKMFDTYPTLTEIVLSEWLDENTDAILRYLIMVYDPKSPIVNNERDLNYRKGIAAQLVGLEDQELCSTIYNSTHPYSADLIVRYLIRFVRSKEWAAICAFETAYTESVKEVIEPISGKSSKERLDSVQKKAAVKEEIIKDIERLDKLYKVFFGEDDELQNKGKRRLTPEMIANR